MNKYYRYSPEQIIGFYCFITDKPKQNVEEKKLSKRVIINWRQYFRPLITPENSQRDSQLWSKYV